MKSNIIFILIILFWLTLSIVTGYYAIELAKYLGANYISIKGLIGTYLTTLIVYGVLLIKLIPNKFFQ